MSTYSSLLTDQYQLVMAYGYWKLGMAEREAVFHLSFRSLPQYSPYMVNAGLKQAIDFIEKFKFTFSDIEYLRKLTNDRGHLFSSEFLEYLEQLTFTGNLDAIIEGNLVFAKEPVLRVQGPILQCQLLETPLLNFLNFATLIATKASLICQAAKDSEVIEFGMRRAQGPDGAITASRSAYLGGCSSTSNAMAGKLYGIPIKGTQAHSWIMAFPTELEAFKGFAQAMGRKIILLVDTYNSIEGIHHAIEIGKTLKKAGRKLAAIRLDSGNLLALSKKARQLLDEADLQETKIIASGDLDEPIIRGLQEKQAPIDSWGVGTRLVTSYDQPALNAIYKLGAIKNIYGEWEYKMKISDNPAKSTIPGIQQVRRYFNVKDVIYDVNLEERLEGGTNLLEPIFRQGELIYKSPTLSHIREICMSQVRDFSAHAVKPYPVMISESLQEFMANYSNSHRGT